MSLNGSKNVVILVFNAVRIMKSAHFIVHVVLSLANVVSRFFEGGANVVPLVFWEGQMSGGMFGGKCSTLICANI